MEYEEYYLEQQPNKPVFPSGDTNGDGFLGINFREALIIALAGNNGMMFNTYELKDNAINIIAQADVIIEQLVRERKKK